MSFLKVVFVAVIMTLVGFIVTAIVDELLPSKLLAAKAVCEVTETREDVVTSALGASKELREGKMTCSGEKHEFYKPKNLPIGRNNWNKVALGQKWQCKEYQTPIFSSKKYRECELL